MKKPAELVLFALYFAILGAIIPHERFTPEFHDNLSEVQKGFEDKYTNLHQPSEDFNRLDPTHKKHHPIKIIRSKKGPKLPIQLRGPKQPNHRPVLPMQLWGGPKHPKQVVGPKIPKKVVGPKKTARPWRP